MNPRNSGAATDLSRLRGMTVRRFALVSIGSVDALPDQMGAAAAIGHLRVVNSLEEEAWIIPAAEPFVRALRDQLTALLDNHNPEPGTPGSGGEET